MRKILSILFLFIVILCYNIKAQTNPLSVIVQTEREDKDTIQFKNKVILAVWLEDLQGHYIKTLALYSKNINHRKHLKEFAKKNPTYNTLDACTGATIQQYDTTISASWNGTDTSNNMLPAGKYVVRCEQTSHNDGWLGHTSRPLSLDTIDLSISKTDTLLHVQGFKTRIYSTFSPKSSDAALKSLTISHGTLSPDFEPNTMEYTVELTDNIDSITLSAEANHDSAIVLGTGTKNISNSGTYKFLITVIAQDSTVKYYSIELSKITNIETVSNVKNSLKVFPNPVLNILHIELPDISEKASFSLFNSQGQKVMCEILQIQNTPHCFSIKHLPKGLYVVQIQTEKKIFTQKITIQ